MTFLDSTPRPYEPFTVTVVPDRSEVVVVPDGELDLATVGAIDAEVRALLTAGFGKIVVDLRRLSFMDSAGLRFLVSLRNDAARRDFTLKLVPGPREVQRIFEVTATRGLFAWRDY